MNNKFDSVIEQVVSEIEESPNKNLSRLNRTVGLLLS